MLTRDEYPQPVRVIGVADANTGDNAQVHRRTRRTSPGKPTCPSRPAVSTTSETMDAFALGLIFAVAIGGDAAAAAAQRGAARTTTSTDGEHASTTGDAARLGTSWASSAVADQRQQRRRRSPLGLGSGVSAISQSNDAGVYRRRQHAPPRTAVATSRRAGGQLNLTGQLGACRRAREARRSPWRLAFGIARGRRRCRVGGQHQRPQRRRRGFNNVQDVTNDGTTGVPGRGELGPGRHAGRRTTPMPRRSRS